MKYSTLLVAEINNGNKQLFAPLHYRDSVFGQITARCSFITDYASIKKLRNIGLLWLYALLVGYGNKAAVIHDWLYSGYGIKQGYKTVYPSRKECDQIFYRALRAEGVARWRAAIFYVGVRVCAAAAYKNKAVWNDQRLYPV